MDRASEIAQEAVKWAQEQPRFTALPSPAHYEAAFAEKLRKYFPEPKRKPREMRMRDALKQAIRLLELVKPQVAAWNEGDDGDLARFREAVKK